jgi:shikimate kinase / 3-dehydroquinate synthase
VIVLVGFMGAGKTTVGRHLARKMGLPFVDSDASIEARAMIRIPEYFAAYGEAAFRDIERQVVTEILDGPEAVVALGGGALGDPSTISALSWANVVYLEVDYGEARRRVGPGFDRPMLGVSDPKALYEERAVVYRNVANLTVNTNGVTPETVADQIVDMITGAQEDTEGIERIVVPLGGRSYPVLVGSDILGRAGELIPETPHAEKAFIVTHPSISQSVPPLVSSLKERGLAVNVIPVPEGEGSKSLTVAGRIYDELAVSNAHRHDLMVSFGGGVISDLAGFVGSTYARGMRVVHVPTTLLGQADAAIGGKTGLDLTHGKNLVGTIYQPVAVICDVDLLAELPAEELTSGLAEVAKYGFIADPSVLDILESRATDIGARDPQVLTDLVARSASIKASIVASDETDQGARHVLNYGHTFGHAIEKAAGFEGVRHGEAVALGMMAAAHLAQELGRVGDEIVELHRAVLGSLGLPVTANLEFSALEEAWMRDKKYKDGVRFVLLADVGKPETDVEAPRSAVVRAVERLRS